jgi:hypothetical protein
MTADRIERLMLAVAKLIDARGDAYLPLFEMLERELEKAQERGGSLARARRLLQQAARP